MEQTAITRVDIDEPMALIGEGRFNENYIPVKDILYHNEEVCLVELDLPLETDVQGARYLSRNFLFEKKTGTGIFGLTSWTVINLPSTHSEPLTLSERARKYAARAHRLINQQYDGKPYMFHVDMAADVARQFRHLIPDEKWETTLAGIYLHDTTEDAHHVTYNNVKEEFGEEVADIAHALANEKGKTRDERANDKYYREMRAVPYAVFGKLCDRIANIQHGVNTGGSMLKRYRKEHAKFVAHTYDPQYQEMFDHLNVLLSH